MKPGRSSSGTWAPVLAAAVVGVLLMAAAIVIQRGIRDASNLVARGMGEAISVAGWETLGGDHYPPDQSALQQFLDSHTDEGLRYVALLDRDGNVARSAGTAVGQGHEDGLTLMAQRARLISRIGGRRVRPKPGEPPPPRPPFNRVVYEWEPLIAIELQRRANELLIAAAVASIGVVLLALALARSLRHRERMGAELENGRRLAALGTMSAVLAHEIRNPLASLKGHAQLLAEDLEENPKLSTKMGRIVGEAARLERLTNDLLAFVKSGELHRSQVDAAQVLREAVEATEPSRIDVTAKTSLPASLDADRLRQALENVLRNAVQASPQDGRVEASVATVGREIVFTVRDHGAGIAPGEEARIFEPFVTGRTKGVGLGLAITRRVVELHGGNIQARNAEGGGAEFTLRMPAKEG